MLAMLCPYVSYSQFATEELLEERRHHPSVSDRNIDSECSDIQKRSQDRQTYQSVADGTNRPTVKVALSFLVQNRLTRTKKLNSLCPKLYSTFIADTSLLKQERERCAQPPVPLGLASQPGRAACAETWRAPPPSALASATSSLNS